MKSYRQWDPFQNNLLPQSPTEWLPEGHLAYFILDVIEELEITQITDAMQSKDRRGERPYNPRMMLALLIYGYCVGVFSSRKIEKATYEDVAFRVIGAGQHPHFSRIAAFRRTHGPSFKNIFLQVLQICQRSGLVKLGHVALDGTKIQANASKHKAMSYDRLCKAEDELCQEIDRLIRQSAEEDAVADARYGSSRGESIPNELKHRKSRLEKIRKARQELEKEAAEQAQRCVIDTPAGTPKCEPPSLPKHQIARNTGGGIKASAQRNFTDPDSRIMKQGQSYVQAYNCQTVVDSAYQVIVAEAVTNHPADTHHLIPLLEETASNAARYPENLTADAGYWTPNNPTYCESKSVNALISPRQNLKREPKHLSQPQRLMCAKLENPGNRALYRMRKAIVEPVYGQIKECRGFRRFHLRGLQGASGEWHLVTLTHNILKLFRHAPHRRS